MHPHKFSKIILGRKFYKHLQGATKTFYLPHFHSLLAVTNAIDTRVL